MREIKFRAVMQRLDGVKYVSQAYSIDNNLSYLFDFENNRWDIFLEMITTEERFVELFPDDDEHLKGWTHIENIQYTGIKDKNGTGLTEVYEGDIISEDGILKGNIYENDKRETDIVVPQLGTKDWATAYKEIVVRGYDYSE